MNATPTHYLHHFYLSESTGRWILVWRRIGTDPRLSPDRPSAHEDGDRTASHKNRPSAAGIRRAFVGVEG